MDIAKRLIAARGNISRASVANAVGVSLSAITMYETGKRIPRDEIKVRLADYYNTSVQELFLILIATFSVFENLYVMGNLSMRKSLKQLDLSASIVLPPQGADGEPYTTSEIIAKGTGMNHRRVRDAIRKYQAELETFGFLGAYATETPGGGRPITGYILNEQQATFLLTLLKNTPVVVAFKTELIRQFYAMRDELTRRREQRALGKPIRRSLTDALRDSGEVERMKDHAYSTFTNLAYKLASLIIL